MTYRFLIYISYSYGVPTGKPLAQEIKARGYEVKWFSDEENGVAAIQHFKDKLQGVDDLISYKPHVVLSVTDSIPDFITGIKVQVFHGFFARKRPKLDVITESHFRLRGFYDLYCTQGPSTTKVFKRLQKAHPYFEVVETGWSKVDPLFYNQKHMKNTGKNKILISSTFTTRLSLANDPKVFEEVKRISKLGFFEFHLILHPKMNPEIVEKWKTLQSTFFFYHDVVDLNPLFLKCDIMFADTTSAIQEFLLLEKPVVTYKHTLPHNYIIDIDRPDQILPAFKSALQYPEELLKNIRAFNRELHPYNDGRSSKRIIDACINFLHKNKEHLAKKPVNLVRKLKVRQKLNHFTPKSYPRAFKLPSPELYPKITAIIPVGNEKYNIEAVVESVSFADEVLVVDSMSTDGTYEKALQIADRVIRREYIHSASQKNWAIPQANHEWILLLDADERVSDALRNEIFDILPKLNNKEEVAYWINRENFFMNKRIHYSGWQSDKVIRLFKRDYCRYEDKYVHSEIQASGRVGKLQNALIHNQYTTMDRHIEKLLKYAELQAYDYDKRTSRITVFHVVIKPLYGFVRHYFLQRGYKDGFVGFTIAYLRSFSIFMRYVKLYLKRKKLK